MRKRKVRERDLEKLTVPHSASKRLIVQLDVVDFEDMHKELPPRCQLSIGKPPKQNEVPRAGVAESSFEACASEAILRMDITFASASGPHCILAVDFLCGDLMFWFM